MRTRNSLYNFVSEMVYSILLIIINFVLRKIIVNYFSIKFLGLTDILNQIINVLSLSELGISNVIMYNLYKPLNENNKKEITQIMNIIKKYYHYVSMIILCLGLLFIPFLKYFINDYNLKINYIIVYLLFLVQSSASYLFTYKIVLIKANQKSYLYTRLMILLKSIMFIIELIILKITNNYIIFLLIDLLSSIFNNIIVSLYINKKYPYIKNKVKILNNSNEKNIKNNIKNSFVSLLSGKITNSSDSIIISLFGNVTLLGLYINYCLILNGFVVITSKVFLSMKASLGEKFIKDDIDKQYEIYKNLNFMSFILSIFITIGYYLMINNVITIWLDKNYLLNDIIVILLSIQLFIFIYKQPICEYISICGMFKEDKYSAGIGCFLNIVLSIILYLIIGIPGVILGTIISQIIQYIIKNYYLFYKRGISKKAIIINDLYKIILYIIIFSITIILKSFINPYISCIIIYMFTIIIFYTIFKNSNELLYIKRKLRVFDVSSFKKNI